MIRGMFGRDSITYQLRGGMKEAMDTHRAIAQRVAEARQASTSDFPGQLQAAGAQLDEDTLTQDMAALADTQLRFEAASRLLQKSYNDLRTAIRGRG